MRSFSCIGIIFLGINILVGCKKDPNEKILGNWKIESVFVNSVDKTQEIDTLYINDYEFSMDENSNRAGDYFVRININEIKAQWVGSCNRNDNCWNC